MPNESCRKCPGMRRKQPWCSGCMKIPLNACRVIEERRVPKEDMEEKTCHPDPVDEDAGEIVRSTRYLHPAHYTFQIKNFSLLLGMEEEKFNSEEFEVGGYRWRLVLYPNGKKNSNENGHISLYLAIADTGDFPSGWEVNTNVRFFVYDQIRDTYLTIQDADGRVRRYHYLKTECGFPQLVSRDTLNDSSNGYLVDDTCVFGVEVFVIKGTSNGECLSIINQLQSNFFTWSVSDYPNPNYGIYKSTPTVRFSEDFIVEGRRWKLKLHQECGGAAASKCLSVDLKMGDSEILPPNGKLHAKYKLRIREKVRDDYFEKTVDCWFPEPQDRDFHEFLPLKDLKDESTTSFRFDLFIECKIEFISVVK